MESEVDDRRSPRPPHRPSQPIPDPVPYEHRRDVEWATKVNRWQWADHERGHVKIDVCPRCGHRMSVFHPTGQRSGIGVIHLPDVSPMFVRCNCDVSHPGAPDGTEGAGCGYHGHISRPPFHL